MDCSNAGDLKFHKYAAFFGNVHIYGGVNKEKDC